MKLRVTKFETVDVPDWAPIAKVFAADPINRDPIKSVHIELENGESRFYERYEEENWLSEPEGADAESDGAKAYLYINDVLRKVFGASGLDPKTALVDQVWDYLSKNHRPLDGVKQIVIAFTEVKDG